MAFTAEAAAIAAARALLELVPFKDPSDELSGVSGVPVIPLHPHLVAMHGVEASVRALGLLSIHISYP